MQLRVINGSGQAVVIAGDEQMFTRMVLCQARNVRRHGLKDHITGLTARGIQLANDLVMRELGIGVVGIPINTLDIQGQACAFERLCQRRYQGHTVVCFRFGGCIGGLAQ